MISNYYTLFHIVKDLQSQITSSTITDVFTQFEGEFVITLKSGEEERFLIVSCEPSRNFLLFTERFSRARRNSMTLFEKLKDARIYQIFIHPADREITLQMAGNYRLIIHLYGPKANAFVVDEHNVIVDAFLKPREVVGSSYIVSTQEEPKIVDDIDGFLRFLRMFGDLTLGMTAKKLLPLFGSTLLREFLHRCSLNEQRKLGELTDAEIVQMHKTMKDMLYEVRFTASPRIYYERDTAILFSVISLNHMSNYHEEQFPSIHNCLKTYLKTTRAQKRMLNEKSPLEHFLKKMLERVERTVKKMSDEATALERPAQYELMGKLIVAYLSQLTKGMEEADLINVYSTERELVTIPLDPALTPHQNAERYFDKAKKSKRSLDEKLERLQEQEAEVGELRLLIGRLENVHSKEDLEKYLMENRELLKSVGYKFPESKEPKEEKVPFRIFIVEGGFTVWAGKSSENNDILTTKFAKPDDLWFHARGSGGSHVVLRSGTGKGAPTKQAIEQAAAIAAYYSKMRNAKNVPVVVTEKKYVYKRKGMPVGTVAVEREKLLFVTPRLPEQEEK